MRWVLFLAAFELLAQDAETIDQHIEAAAAAMRSGDYATAERHDRAIVRLEPGLAEAQVNLGLSCYLQRKYPEAVKAFETGLRLKPDMWNAKLFLGISRFNLNQVSSALPLFSQYVAQRPQDLQGQYYLGLSYLALERYPDAEKTLSVARELDGGNVDVLYHLAQCYLGEAKEKPAERGALEKKFQSILESIAAIDPHSFRLAQLHAGYLANEGKTVEAQHELEKVLEHDPRARGLHYTLGCLYLEQMQYDAARKQFETELSVSAPYPRTYLQLGHVYVATEHPHDALPILKQALAYDPASSGLVWVEFGRAYRMMNQWDAAEQAYEKAIQLGQGTAAVYYQLAIIARKTGNEGRYHEALAASQRLRSEERHTQAPETP